MKSRSSLLPGIFLLFSFSTPTNAGIFDWLFSKSNKSVSSTPQPTRSNSVRSTRSASTKQKRQTSVNIKLDPEFVQRIKAYNEERADLAVSKVPMANMPISAPIKSDTSAYDLLINPLYFWFPGNLYYHLFDTSDSQQVYNYHESHGGSSLSNEQHSVWQEIQNHGEIQGAIGTLQESATAHLNAQSSDNQSFPEGKDIYVGHQSAAGEDSEAGHVSDSPNDESTVDSSEHYATPDSTSSTHHESDSSSTQDYGTSNHSDSGESTSSYDAGNDSYDSGGCSSSFE